MRFNESQDGKPRATLRVEVRIGRPEVVVAVALLIEEDMKNQPPRTRAVVEAKLRELAETRGRITDSWIVEPLEDWVWQDADIATDRLFPELVEPELAR